MGLILRNLVPKEEEDVAAMPDPGLGIENLLKKYRAIKAIYDGGGVASDDPDLLPQEQSNYAIAKNQIDPPNSPRKQDLDVDTLSEGLIGKAMFPYQESRDEQASRQKNYSGSTSAFNLDDALKGSGTLAEMSKELVRKGTFNDLWSEQNTGQMTFSAIPWKEPAVNVPGTPGNIEPPAPTSQYPDIDVPYSDRTENERNFDDKIKAGTFNRTNEISHAWNSEKSLSDRVSDTWDAFNYVRPDALEYRASLMQPTNIKAAILDNMLAGPIPAITAGIAQILGKSDSDIYHASQLGIALDGLATARASVAHPMAFTGARDMPALAPPKIIDTRKPYANPRNRPPYHPNQVETVWTSGVKNSPDGNVYDPNLNIQLNWDRTKNRSGQWDMGHLPGYGYAELHARYMNDDITREKFLKEYRNPANYRPELPRSNRGRRNEGY
ncbi:HNH/ENDO VII family nuclease [Undibacterium sp.]|jgi:hypothetical protein|uniref:HNH/ENDO VII family nuclease n=1 Tax=Undibacterium sp. TaxID=1914977 RepID=UPI002C579125|nr:HNH/ENDO VII family nuclease [Undibacterium sp.]HTD06014.1 HNH/ENDO VII family nuclease [Undibacterium sp.]